MPSNGQIIAYYYSFFFTIILYNLLIKFSDPSNLSYIQAQIRRIFLYALGILQRNSQPRCTYKNNDIYIKNFSIYCMDYNFNEFLITIFFIIFSEEPIRCRDWSMRPSRDHPHKPWEVDRHCRPKELGHQTSHCSTRCQEGIRKNLHLCPKGQGNIFE